MRLEFPFIPCIAAIVRPISDLGWALSSFVAYEDIQHVSVVDSQVMR